MAVYALLVGIDVYPAPVPRLHGAGNDALAARGWLLDAGVPPEGIRLLRDGEATRAAILAGFEEHLGQARDGDTAVFWYAGHGSQQPVPARYAHLESSGLMQTVVCVDSRTAGGRDLADKELRVLIHRLAGRGAHVLTVMDCCHAESSTRRPDGAVEAVRSIARRADAPGGGLLPELADPAVLDALLERTEGAAPDHVALGACRYHQGARELRLDEVRGVFSLALTVELYRARRAGALPTYRDLLTAARCYVENRLPDQQPVLYPDASPAELADRPFLGGAVVARPAPLTMSWRGGWEIDAGSCHGITAPTDHGETRVAVAERGPLREARVLEVRPERSVVAPIGWQPDLSRQYPVVVSAVALPEATAVPTVGAEGGQAAVDLFTAAANTAGPGGGPSAHLRVAAPAEAPESSWLLEVRAVRPGALRLIDPEREDPATLPDLSCSTAAEARAAVAVAEHLARWRRIRALANPASALDGRIRLELVHAPAGVRRDDGRGAPLRPGPDGVIALEYTLDGDTWAAPRVFLRLRNTSGRRLHCVLLDLTDRYQIATGLFDGDPIGPGHTAFVRDGAAVEMRLPAGRALTPGARTTDWFKVLISPEPLSAQPFRMAPADRPRPAGDRAARTRHILESFGYGDGRRVAHPETVEAAEWAAVTIPVSTGIPKRTGHRGPLISESYRSY